MKKHVYWGIGIAVCIGIVVSFVVMTQQTSDTQVHAEVQAGFLVHIPYEWVGKYATSYTGQGDVVFYFTAPEGSIPLFVIHKRSEVETLPEGVRVIGENNGFVYGVTQTEKGIYSGEESSQFNALQKSVPTVIASFTFL